MASVDTSAARARQRHGESLRRTRPQGRAAQGAKRPQRPNRRAGASLGNSSVIRPVSVGHSDPEVLRRQRRSERWAMRDGLRAVTTRDDVRGCGIVPVANGVRLMVADRHTGGSAGYGGVATCGNVWLCPVCSAKIASRRRDEVQAVVDAALERGCYVSMLTLTMRHNAGQKLGHLWDSLQDAWAHVASGRRWQTFREQMGWIGFIRAVEVTHGKHGWHVHTHILCITEKDPTSTPYVWQRKQGRAKRPYPAEVQMPRTFIAERWEAGLAKNGVEVVADKGGVDWEVARDAARVGTYVAKMGVSERSSAAISAETTLGGFKKARGENRTPFQILADIIETGDADDAALWRTFEKASRGRRALVWSRGLREWAGLGAEKTDEEIAAEEEGGSTVAVMSNREWLSVRRAEGGSGAIRLLEVAESGGAEAAYAWLDAHGVSYLKVTTDDPPSADEG